MCEASGRASLPEIVEMRGSVIAETMRMNPPRTKPDRNLFSNFSGRSSASPAGLQVTLLALDTNTGRQRVFRRPKRHTLPFADAACDV